MGYFKELYDKPIQPPTREFAVVGRKYISQSPKEYILERAKSSFAKYNLKVKGTDGIKYYKGKHKPSSSVICTLDNVPLLKIKESQEKKIRKDVYIGNDKSILVSQIKCRNSKSNYKISVKNLIRGEEEYLQMNSDRKLVVCGIFYGKEKEGAPLIAKIIRDNHTRTKCTLEIAPNVDIIFMMGLAAFFSDRFSYVNKRIRRRNKESLDFDSSDDDENNDNDDDNGDGDGNNGNDDNDYIDLGFHYGDCNTDGYGGFGEGWGDGGDGGGGDGGGGDGGGGD
jgi:uncharacterized membrane protein YgcG